MKLTHIVLLAVVLYVTPQALAQYRFGPPRRVEGYYKGNITPHWLADNKSFWYRNDVTGGTKEFILVNAEQGTRQSAFNHEKLAAALSKAAGSEYKADKLPFDSIEFADEGKSVRFSVDQTGWTCDLATYACAKTDATPSQSSNQDYVYSLLVLRFR